jgi:hypothetical protein
MPLPRFQPLNFQPPAELQYLFHYSGSVGCQYAAHIHNSVVIVGVFIAWNGSKKHHEISMISFVDYQDKRTTIRRRRSHKIIVRMEHTVDQSTPSNRQYNWFYWRQFS